ncbi:nose resistant to fluoxetine protein 6 isoform X2 [Patella vulgata]|uniref:nose resistant to fluoxetine protein 6 isoform X2 n=1 Tax=Patella vulgata TaxID=6465 RepID=UPI0021800C57|nr:nose resistant to fluoxetine protein 6 isoform X2 [Patella vulgata]
MIRNIVFVCLLLCDLNCVLSQQPWSYVHMISTLGSRSQILESQKEDYAEEIKTIQESAKPLSLDKLQDYAQRLLESSELLRTGVKLGADANVTVSKQCINDTTYFLTSIILGQQWALRMFDSFGKPSSGILQFELNWVGSYDECIAIRAPYTEVNQTTDTGEIQFKGQYCTAVLPFTPETSATPASPMPSVGVQLGICLPNSCSAKDMVLLLNDALHELVNITGLKIGFQFSNLTSRCQNEDLEYDSKAIAAIVVGTIFGLLLVIGTLYDFMFVQMPKWSQSADEDDGNLNSNQEANGSMNIKYHRHSDENTPLIGETKTSIDNNSMEPGICGKALLSFSAYSNGLKILSTKQPKGSLQCIHGIRFFSMTWVILGHTLVFAIGNLENFATYFPPLLKRFTFQAISNATVSVDTFFTLSGLLISYLTLKELKKTEGKLNWFMFYFHRYWRLTPPYMFLMLLYVPLFPYFTNGPSWPQKGVEINQCEGWWTNLLYVNNIVKTNEICMGWSWYLANDMQFYILCPLLIVPFFYSKFIGFAVSTVFLLTTTITAGAVSAAYSMAPGLAATPMAMGGTNTSTNATASPASMDFFLKYYITPWCRMGPYIIGIMVGYYLYVTELRFRWNKLFVAAGWAVSTASALAVLYGLYDTAQGHPISVDTAAFYNAVNRTVWGACVCWVIVACVGGYGGPVNVILSWKALIPLSRLTYCAYLIHPIIMYAVYYAQIKPIAFTDSLFVYYFFAHLVAAYMLAFVLSLMFESPMMGLENVIFKRKRRN